MLTTNHDHLLDLARVQDPYYEWFPYYCISKSVE